MQEVVDGVGRQPQLRKDHEGDALVVPLAQELAGPLGVEAGIGDVDARDASRDPDEIVAIG